MFRKRSLMYLCHQHVAYYDEIDKEIEFSGIDISLLNSCHFSTSQLCQIVYQPSRQYIEDLKTQNQFRYIAVKLCNLSHPQTIQGINLTQTL